MSERLNKYSQLLDQWLKYYGFEELIVNPEAGADKVYKRSRVEAAKFGKVDFYIAVKHVPNATSELLRPYSSKMHSLAMRHRTGPPLGFGAMLQVFPLVITENISEELADFIKSSYCPKHFGAAEFPSVIDLATGYVYYYASTPLWGYAYYAASAEIHITSSHPRPGKSLVNSSTDNLPNTDSITQELLHFIFICL